MHANGQPLAEISTSHEAEAAWAMGRDLLVKLKQEAPRLLALTLTTAAMLHCDHQDHLWRLHTPRASSMKARDGAILHAPPEADVRPVSAPLLPWEPISRRCARSPNPPRRRRWPILLSVVHRLRGETHKN